MVYYIDDIMWTGPNEQEVAITLDLLVRHLCVREFDKFQTKFDKNSGVFSSEIFRGPLV